MRGIFGIIICAMVMAIMSCNDPTIVGSGLVEGEGLNVAQDTTAKLSMRTIKNDKVISLVAFRNNGDIRTQSLFPLGELNDPLYGKSTASFYTEVGLSSSSFLIDEDYVLDSLVLVLSLDTLGSYGDKAADYTVNVYRVQEALDVLDTVLSNQTFLTDDSPIGSLNMTGVSFDSVDVYSPILDSLLREPAQIRIPLSAALGNELIADTISQVNGDSLSILLKGFFVTATTSSSSMAGINITSGSLNSRLELYATRGDTTHSVYTYIIGGNRSHLFQDDISGSYLSTIVDDFTAGDSLLYLTGLNGFDTEIDLSATLIYQDYLINKAELTFTLADIPEIDQAVFPPATYLSASISNNGLYTSIDDLSIAEGSSLRNQIFGGILTEVEQDGETIQQFTINITNHLQDFLRGEKDSKMILHVTSKAQTPNTTILYGPGHSKYPVKLKVTYTLPE